MGHYETKLLKSCYDFIHIWKLWDFIENIFMKSNEILKKHRNM